MLNLLHRLELEGLTLFRDDERPHVFYALPDQPVLPPGEDGKPELLFIKYLRVAEDEAEDVGGGYLQFRCTLQIGEQRRQRVLDALRAQLERERAQGVKPFGRALETTEPALAAPTWKDGSVGLHTFRVDEETGHIVRKAATTGVPDLAGDLGASAVVQLDPDGAEIFWSAFQSGTVPIVVAYELTYLARVPAGGITIKAKREEIEKKLWTLARPFVWARSVKRLEPVALPAGHAKLTPAVVRLLHAQLGKKVHVAVPRPEVERIVRTEVTVEAHAGLASAEELSLDLRQQMTELASRVLSESLVMPSLFEQQVPGALAGEDEELAVVKVPAEGEEPPTVELSMTLSQDGVVERRVAPNGPLRVLMDEEQLRTAFMERRLADGFFATHNVLATSEGVDFEGDGIALMTVEVAYDQRDAGTGERVQRGGERLLSAEQPEARWRFDLARDAEGRHLRTYRYRTEVEYVANVPRTVTPWRETDEEILVLSPRSLLAMKVQVVLAASPEVVASARVDLRYRRADGETLGTHVELTAAEPKQTWFQPTGELQTDEVQHPAYEHRITWRLAGGGLVTADWETSRDRTLVVSSPLDAPLVFDLQPQGFTSSVSRIAGTLVYADAERGYEVRRTFSFGAAADSAKLAVPALRGGPRTATITWRAERAGGAAPDEGRQEGVEAGTVFVGPVAGGTLAIEVSPVLIDFEQDVELAVVRLRYQDPAHGLDLRKTFQFRKDEAGSHQAVKVWEIERADPQANAFSYVIDFIAYDRARSSRVEVESTEDTLVLLDRAATDGG